MTTQEISAKSFVFKTVHCKKGELGNPEVTVVCAA